MKRPTKIEKDKTEDMRCYFQFTYLKEDCYSEFKLF